MNNLKRIDENLSFCEIPGGSTLEAMADAIEGSYLVLIFFSEAYKKSANCHSGEDLQLLLSLVIELIVRESCRGHCDLYSALFIIYYRHQCSTLFVM